MTGENGGQKSMICYGPLHGGILAIRRLVYEISLRCKKLFFVAIYRSSNEVNDEFEAFFNNLQDTIIDQIKDAKPHCTILTGNI